jgi:adenosine kinase
MENSNSLPTGICASIVHEKERSLVAQLGAALHYPTSFAETLSSEIRNASVFYATAFFLTSNSSVLLNLIEAAKRSHTTFAFNLSATFLIEQYRKEMIDIIGRCNYLFGNEDEFKHLAEVMGLKQDVDT